MFSECLYLPLTSSLKSTHVEQALTNYSLWANFDLSPVFVKKFLLELSHIHPIIYCLWLFLHNNCGAGKLQQRFYSLKNLQYTRSARLPEKNGCQLWPRMVVLKLSSVHTLKNIWGYQSAFVCMHYAYSYLHIRNQIWKTILILLKRQQ